MSGSSQPSQQPDQILANEVPDFVLSTGELVMESARLLWGLSLRYFASCGAWSLYYIAYDRLRKVPPQETKKKTKARWNMWSKSFWMEVGVSLATVPGRYLTGRTSARLLFDFTFMQWGDWMSTFDRFHPRNYIGYAINRLTPSGEYDFSFFLWQLPASLLNAYKLYKRRKMLPESTYTGRCIAALCLQYINRLLLLSFSVYLPRNIEELLMSGLMTTFDKALDAYLIRNTWYEEEDVVALSGPEKTQSAAPLPGV